MVGGLSCSTEKNYKNLWKKVCEENIMTEGRGAVVEFLDRHTYYMKRNYLLAIYHFLKDEEFRKELGVSEEDFLYYRKLMRDICLEDTLSRVKRDITENESENYISWDHVLRIRNIRKEMKDRKGRPSQGNHMMYIITCLYTYLPPQRGQVFYNCYIDKDIEGANMIDLSCGKLIVREHKVKKAYGTIELELGEELVEILREYKNKWLGCDGGRLLSTDQGKEVSESSFNRMMNNIFGNGISTNMLRKIYVSHMVGGGGMTIDERKKLAKNMGHSINTQEYMYHKRQFITV